MTDSTLKGIASHSAIIAIVKESWQPNYVPAAKPKPGQEDLLYADADSQLVYAHIDFITACAVWMLTVTDKSSRPGRLAYVYGAPCPEDTTAEAHARYIKRRREAAGHMEEIIARLDATFAQHGPQFVMDAIAVKIERLAELTGLRLYATGKSITKASTCPKVFANIKTEIKLYGSAGSALGGIVDDFLND